MSILKHESINKIKVLILLLFLFVLPAQAAVRTITYETGNGRIREGESAVSNYTASVVSSLSRPFTIALIPDTQNISFNNTNVFTQMTYWLQTNAEALNLAAVLALGDCVEHQGSSNAEWFVASNAYSLITNVPVEVPPGNHDYDAFAPRDLTHFNTYFTEGFYTNRSWFSGDFYEAGHRENVYCLVTNGTTKLLLFALEFGPTTNTLQWVTNIAAQYPQHDVYLVTHNYLMPDGTRNSDALGDPYTPASYGITNGADGVGIWENLKTVQNLRMIACGHQLQLDGDPAYESHSLALGTHGNWVNQVFVNYQQFAGVAAIALLTVYPDTGQIEERTWNVEPAVWTDTLGGKYTMPSKMSGQAPGSTFTNGNGVALSIDEKGILSISTSNSTSSTTTTVGINDDLVLYWPFSETSGTTTTDATTNAFTGTLTSSTMITNGVLGHGLDFISGSSQQVAASSTATVSGLTNLTVAVWFKTTNNISGSVDMIAKHAGSVNGEFQLALTGNSNILFTVINASGSRVDMTPNSTTYNDGYWHLATGTYDGATMRTWLDGQCLGTASQTGSVKSYATVLRVGAYNGGQYFNGQMDEVKIWSRGLQTNEVAAIWLAGGMGANTNVVYSSGGATNTLIFRGGILKNVQ